MSNDFLARTYIIRIKPRQPNLIAGVSYNVAPEVMEGAQEISKAEGCRIGEAVEMILNPMICSRIGSFYFDFELRESASGRLVDKGVSSAPVEE